MRTLLTRSLIAALALLIALGAFSGAAWAKTIFVNNAPGIGDDVACIVPPFTTPCKTIAVAVNTVGLLAAGDTVQIFPGFYPEIVTSTVTVPNVSIVGAGPSTIIEGSFLVTIVGAGDVGTPVLSIQANNVTVANFTILRSPPGAATAAFVTICGPTATTPDIAKFNPLIRVGSIATATSGVIIHNVEVTANAVGIAICNSSNTQIVSNNIHDNPAAAVSLAILQSNGVLVQSNVFSNAPLPVANTGVLLAGIAANITRNNTIRNNSLTRLGASAIQISAFTGVPGVGGIGNTIDSNIFTIPAAGIGINFPVGAPVGVTGAIANTVISNNTFDGGNAAGTIGINLAPALVTDLISLTQIQANQIRRLATGIVFAPAAAAFVNTTTVTNNLIADNNTAAPATGIAFTTASTTTNNQFTRNVITRNTIGVSSTAVILAASLNNFTLNNIEGNLTNGWSLFAGTIAGTFLASNNWWGDPSGPFCLAAACNTVGGTGNSVVGAPAFPLGTTPVSPVPFATVFGTSLERAPAALSVSSIQAVGLGGFRPGLQVRVQGQGIAGVQLQVYDLSGRLVTNQSASGPSLRWNGLASTGRTLANGVYLYVVSVKGQDGAVIRSEVRKLVILR